MQVFLIEDTNNKNILKKWLKKIEIESDRILVNQNMEKLKINKKIKIVRKISQILKESNVKNIILSNNLKKDKKLVNLFYSNNLNIIEGKELFKKLIIQIIDNICDTPQEKNISVAINLDNTFGISCIEILCKKFKTLNVVTNNTSAFKILKERLWEENGIIITITNNKKKALYRSDIILNIDFPEEIINKYLIYDEAILINLEETVKIKKKRFCGKIINDYKIKAKENSNLDTFLKNNDYEKFDIKDIVEVYIANNPKEIQNIIIV